MESGTISLVNPNKNSLLVLEKDDKQFNNGTYMQRRYMCQCNNLIFNLFHMKRKVEDYNLDLSVKLILSSKYTNYEF